MLNIQKKSIRFYNDKPVRAVWNESDNTWHFSVLDIIAAIRNEESYEKAKNYWKYLKSKLKRNNSGLVSMTTQLKLEAMKDSVIDSSKIHKLLNAVLTNKINDREIFMTGIDYSYYYEED